MSESAYLTSLTSLAAHLHALAAASNMSYSDIADKMGVTRGYVSNLLNRQSSEHTAERYVELADVLGYSLETRTRYVVITSDRAASR